MTAFQLSPSPLHELFKKKQEQITKMPPIRRYLRITRYSVLEVRIHLDNPTQTSWLLNGANPALPRIIAAIRPLVLPKLREENERSKLKSVAKKRGIKDIVTGGKMKLDCIINISY
jgi:hypothetical protein